MQPDVREAAPEAIVAIVMRTKNRPVLLRRALADVLAQSFEDWVLVVVNDGGAPGPVDAVVAEAADRRPGRIHVIHNPRSVGMEAASNIGVRATRSRYLVIHDDDDEWHPDFLSRTVDFLDRERHEGVMVRTEIVYERVVGDHIETLGRETFWADMHAITLFEMLAINRAVPISFLYRREVHDRIGYFDESLPAVGDWEFHLRFLRDFTIGFIDGEPLAFWNQRRGAGGDLGNSVLDNPVEHENYDLLVREHYLREDVHRYGLGTLLYVTKLLDDAARAERERAESAERSLADVVDALRAVESRLHALESATSDASIVSLLRRRYRRYKAKAADRRTEADV